MPAAKLIVCHECDVLLREPALADGCEARCPRCGAALFAKSREGLERTLALTLGALVLFVVSNSFPILGLEVQAHRTATTLYGAVLALRDQEMPLVAGLVFVTTILVPAVDLAAMTYLLLPLSLGRRPPSLAEVFRLVQSVRPWGMVEVFILGVLVSLVKLAHLASVLPGVALWSFGGLMLLMAAAAASFDAREFWVRVEALR
jgi:paraquat-inducible protein A